MALPGGHQFATGALDDSRDDRLAPPPKADQQRPGHRIGYQRSPLPQPSAGPRCASANGSKAPRLLDPLDHRRHRAASPARYRQFGKAVAVLVAEWIICRITAIGASQHTVSNGTIADHMSSYSESQQTRSNTAPDQSHSRAERRLFAHVLALSQRNPDAQNIYSEPVAYSTRTQGHV